MGVGMPAALKLDEFGSHIWSAFGQPAYHVGSSLSNKSDWRDVDVRLILDDDEYKAMGLGDPGYTGINGKWIALCLAFSALGKEMTGLPIDFQIQAMGHANKAYQGEARSAIGLVPLRRIDKHGTDTPKTSSSTGFGWWCYSCTHSVNGYRCDGCGESFEDNL